MLKISIFSISAEQPFPTKTPELPCFVQGQEMQQLHLLLIFSVMQTTGNSNLHFDYKSLACYTRGG